MKPLFAELRSRLGSNLKGVLPKWHGPFQARFTHSVIPSEVEESLILTITSSKRCLDCARHDKKPIWATRPAVLTLEPGKSTYPTIETDSSQLRDTTLRASAEFGPLPSEKAMASPMLGVS